MSAEIPIEPETWNRPQSEVDLELGVEGAPSLAPPARSGNGDRAKRLTKRGDKDISLSHHAARCSICKHPDREAIEQGFLHWESPTLLAYEYDLGRRRAVYRHARALGLFEKRAARTRRSLEFVIEQAETVTATADSVIRAVRAYSCVSENGRWTEPAKRVIVEHIDRVTPERSSAAPSAPFDGVREGDSGPSLITRHSPLVTASDGHARPSKNAVTPAAPTKVRKLMGTLFKGLERRFSAAK